MEIGLDVSWCDVINDKQPISFFWLSFFIKMVDELEPLNNINYF